MLKNATKQTLNTKISNENFVIITQFKIFTVKDVCYIGLLSTEIELIYNQVYLMKLLNNLLKPLPRINSVELILFNHLTKKNYILYNSSVNFAFTFM